MKPKTILIFCFTVVLGLFLNPVRAQKVDPAHPPKVSKYPKPTRKPGDLKTPPTLKIAPPCKTPDGKDRLFACEFSFDKLEVYAKDGSLIGKMTRAFPTLKVPLQKAKTGPAAGGKGLAVYTVKAYFTRWNAPAFSAAEGYRLVTCETTNCGNLDQYLTVFDGQPMPLDVYSVAVQTFDLSWRYDPTSGGSIGPRSLFLENKVTANNHGLGENLAFRSEASLIFSIQIFE